VLSSCHFGSSPTEQHASIRPVDLVHIVEFWMAALEASRLLKSSGEQERAKRKSSTMNFLQLLTKSGAVGSPSSDICAAEFLNYRQKNLQWRTGSSQGARGEVTDIERAAGSTPAGNELHRCSSWPTFPLPPVERKIWMLSPDMECDLQDAYPHIWRQLQTHAGLILQMVILLLVVLTYAACPLTVSWAKVVGIENEVPIKGRPFKESSVIVVSRGLIALVGLALSAATGGYRSVAQCLDKSSMLMFAPAGAGWAIADVCEVLAVARIDPATYGVISQARLLGSAAACWLIRGMRQTQLQWGVLGALSLVCMAYCVVPDDPVTNDERLFRWRFAALTERFSSQQQQQVQSPLHEQMIGYTLALAKVALSVISGVYGETCFKAASANGSPPELHIQMTQIGFSSMVSAIIGHCVICQVSGEDMWDFFGGPDGVWDYRTFLLACIYCWREWICNLCVKRFDSLVKNICNAVALVVTYGITVVASKEKPFSALKVLLLLAVVAEVVNYSATRRTVTPAVKKAEEGTPSKTTDFEMVTDIPVAEYCPGLPRPPRKLPSFETKGVYD